MKSKNIWETILKWAYRTLCYFFPSGVLLWSFVIENALSDEVSVITKVGVCGVFMLAILLCMCVFMVNRAFNKKEKELRNASIEEVDLEKRKETIGKLKRLDNRHDLFKCLVFLGVLVAITLVVAMLESKLLSLRGTMIAICISFASGTGCMVAFQSLKTKRELGGNEETKLEGN